MVVDWRGGVVVVLVFLSCTHMRCAAKTPYRLVTTVDVCEADEKYEIPYPKECAGNVYCCLLSRMEEGGGFGLFRYPFSSRMLKKLSIEDMA